MLIKLVGMFELDDIKYRQSQRDLNYPLIKLN